MGQSHRYDVSQSIRNFHMAKQLDCIIGWTVLITDMWMGAAHSILIPIVQVTCSLATRLPTEPL